MIHQLLGDSAAWFTVPAVIGTLYFLVQLLLMNAGGDLNFDVDVDGVHGHDGGGEIRVLSFQTISAFFMGAGWVGLAAYRLLDLGFTASSMIAIVGGLGTGWIIISTSKLVLKLQSSGNIDISDTLGLAGDVCVSLPPEGLGRGRVRLVVQNRLREFDAVQGAEGAIASGVRVKVVGVDVAANTVRVEAVD